MRPSARRRGVPIVRLASLLLLLLLLTGRAVPLAAQGPAASVGEPPAIGAVFGEVPGDLWRFLSLDTAAVLGIGGIAAATAHEWDDELSDEVQTNTTFNAAMEPGHTYGAFSVQSVIGVGLYATGWFAKNGRLATVGADIMRVQILSQAYTQVIKYTAQRERPDGSDHLSFPSGHSASAFATALVLQRHYGWKVGVPATAAAAYVAMARVHDNHHHLSDVIFGAAMGAAAQRTVMLRAGRYGFVLAPALGGGRVSVSAVVVPRSSFVRRGRL